MQKNESSLPPPVPPRRKRCKIKSKQPISTSPPAKIEFKRQPPHPILSPAAPQRVRIGRKTPSPSPIQNITSDLSNALSSIESIPDSHSKTSKNDFPVSQYEEKNISEAVKTSPKTFNTYKLDKNYTQASRSNSPFSLPRETNKYPPLYFTFQDYQTVMEDSSNFRNVNSDKISDHVEETKISASSSFVENVMFHNEREEIYFRVTTTDRPFEKCLGEWSKDYDEDVQEFKEKQPDIYIFEDYIDRSKKLNARPHLLLSEDFFSMPQDDNSASSTERSTTRVRFLIESPSTSTPDLDLDDDTTGYGDFIDKQFENREKSSIQLFEVTDEELQNPDDNTNETTSELNTDSKMELVNVEDENLSGILYGLTTNQVDDSYSDWEEDVDVYTFPKCTEIGTNVYPFLPEHNKLESKENVEKSITLQKEVTNFVNEEGDTITNYIENQGLSEAKKVFIHSSLYDLPNNNNDLKVSDVKTDNAQIDGNIQLIIPKIIEPSSSHDDDNKENHVNCAEKCYEIEQSKNVEELQVDIKSSVPATYDSRSTFLETMLNENALKSEKSIPINCKVIAAHPKQSSNLVTMQENSKPQKNSLVSTNESKVVPKDNSHIKVTEPGLQKKISKINVNLNNNKSAGEVKGDVLNELLTNFNTIKLKPVNKNTRESIWLNDLKSDRKDENKSVDLKTDAICEIRQELESTKCKDDKNTKVELKLKKDIVQNSLKGVEEPNVNASTNKDVRAIVKEAPYVQRIENDNKITTPVIVSKDQYREAVSITPGSVRSFVKYYEIHSEISNISKIKDNAFKKHKSELSLQREKTKAGKKSTKATDKNKKTSSNITLKAESKMKEKEKISCQSSKVSLQHLSPSSKSKPFIQKQSCMKSSVPSPKPERKKSVQFDNDHTIISPRKKEKEKEKGIEEEEGTFSSFIGGIRTRLKGKAPGKPDVKKVEQPKVVKQGQWRNESTAIFCIQKSPEAKTVACTAKPGNIGFLPQTETLQNSQTIVFYCTV